MHTKKIHNKGQARIFTNSYLEMLTKTHPAVLYLMYLPLIAWMLYHSVSNLHFHWQQVVLIFFSGMLFWTLFEYTAHRFLFHISTDNPSLQRIVYIFHGNHHEYPRDKERLIMPPIPSLIFATVFFSMMYLVLSRYAFSFFPGFLLGYVLYVSLHYAIHAMAPPFKWLKPLWRNHHLHHYKDEHMGFGVSNLFWDHIFGTAFDLSKHQEDKEKVKDLMFKD